MCTELHASLWLCNHEKEWSCMGIFVVQVLINLSVTKFCCCVCLRLFDISHCRVNRLAWDCFESISIIMQCFFSDGMMLRYFIFVQHWLYHSEFFHFPLFVLSHSYLCRTSCTQTAVAFFPRIPAYFWKSVAVEVYSVCVLTDFHGLESLYTVMELRCNRLPYAM